MAAKRGRFEELYRQEVEGGKSTLGALKSSAAERRRELTDLRRMFPSSGILGAMLESAFGKAYKYKGKGSAGVADKESASFDNKTLNAVRLNTAISAKNSMVLPGMARDMNVMRQNIVKLTKNATGSAATKADAFFLKSKEREASYENQIADKSPTRADGKQSGKDKEKGGFFSGLLSSILGMGIKDILAGLLKGGLIAGLIYGIGKYFKDPEFKKSVNDMLNSLGTSIFGAEYWENLKTTIKDNLVEGALIVGGSYLAFKGAVALFTSALTGAAGTLTTAMGSMMRNPYVLAAIGLGVGAYAYNDYRKMKKIGEAIDAGQLKGIRDEIWKQGNYDHESGFEDPNEVEKLNLELMETLRKISEDKSNTAYRRGVAKSLLLEIEKGQEKLPTKEEIILKNEKLGQKYDSGEVKPVRGLSQEQIDIDKKINDLMAEKNPAKNSSEISKLQKQKKLLKGTGPTIESSKDTGVSDTSPSRMSSDIKFSDLTPEQQLAVVREQRRQEGFYPGSASYDLNNPGNMVYSEQTAKFGAVLDPSGMRGTGDVKGKLAMFPSLAAGEAAQMDLLSKGVNYRNLSLDDALKRWTGTLEKPEESANYRSNIFAKLQIDHKDAVNENTDAVNNLNKQMQEEKDGTFVEMLAALLEGMAASTTGTNVTNINNNSVSGGGGVASPYNEDMLALFKNRATQGV
jgi:hypothetical protein